jgi:hypothetical protein
MGGYFLVNSIFAYGIISHEEVSLMSKLKIIYDKEDIPDIIKSAISAEVKRLEVGLDKTNKEIKKLEEKYAISSKEFSKKITADDLKGGDYDYVKWSGELKIRERILQDLKRLKNIKYVTN